MNAIKIFFAILLSTFLTLVFLELIFFTFFAVKDGAVSDQTTEIEIGENPNQDEETLQFHRDTQTFKGYPYKAFVGWESPEISSESLNVGENLIRVTDNTNSDRNSDATAHFFGGSTMWGHSVSDKNTIPSQFSKISGINSINYGEQAYNSRQSLNRFLNNMSEIQPDDTMIFFDGVNDVYHNCLSINSADGHPREGYMRSMLGSKPGFTNGLMTIIKSTSTYRFARGIGKKFSQNDSQSRLAEINKCDDEEYSDAVASFLVNSWAAADAIAKEKGIKFLCVLQPNPYTLETTPYSHNATYEKQTQNVYPKIREKAEKLDCFRDYSNVLKEDFYVDHCCHVNAQGNLEIAKQFARDVN